jgi:hypothetical protein
MSDKKTASFSVRLTEEEKKGVVKSAAAQRKTISEWLRALVQGALRRANN